MKYEIQILAADDMFLASLSAIRDTLRLANLISSRHQLTATRQLPTFECRLLSVEGRKVTSFCGTPLAVDGAIEEAGPASAIVIPAIFTAPDGMRDDLQWLEQPDYAAQATKCTEAYLRERAPWLAQVVAWLQKQRQEGAVLAGVSTGTLVLAEAGLLKRMRVPIPWMFESGLSRRYPGLLPAPHQEIVVNNDIYCAATLGSSLPLALELVRRFLPVAVADLLAQNVHGPQPPLFAPATTASAATPDRLVTRAMALIQQRFTRPVDYGRLALGLAVSQRTLIRHFRRDLGMTPQAYQQQLRIEAAQRLLATIPPMSITQVAEQIGYTNTSYFCRLFKQRLGVTPQAYQTASRKPHTGTAASAIG
jgi:transcriptional regulator GlxA family with amidase domain